MILKCTDEEVLLKTAEKLIFVTEKNSVFPTLAEQIPDPFDLPFPYFVGIRNICYAILLPLFYGHHRARRQ